jgi:toxic protein SymE
MPAPNRGGRRWLASLGFTTGQRIEVITEPGQLIIRLAAKG